MPLIRISLRRGRPASHPAAIVDGVYRALRATFEVPENDLFAVVHQHEADEFVFDANFFGFQRSAGLVIIQITVTNTRGVTQKKALFAAIAANLAGEPGLKPDDVFINLVEVKREDWSFGGGVAQYVA
ncbi:MAG TPA: tautomerase family protein [Bosea sp. (in: a-proteobacteria)]|jgi:4-oxalocrotonate tautomerase|uniref:tautomerase family protein n=1 Tax=Bosea sp. (in: a-proteobacteria) TaxID=1871050 RepID=UPI002DDCC9A2|nr:tautomerase family protein [Bosea sp. (in: a-proteobacteria)]HEV2555966.1 tautomerase family protein [Bosea sp. (in: a-proteobacteria)]